MAFCSNCGTQYSDGTRFCPKCGAAAVAQPMAPPVYAPPQQQAPYGGYAPPPQAPYPNYAPYAGMQAQQRYGGKSKTTAVILAFFFGYWSWLYTFKRDRAKFFICLLLSILASAVYVISGMYYISYFFWPVFWLWPFINSIMRGSQWYAQY
jgi:hypothetical protein